jgi:hypothetical protein
MAAGLSVEDWAAIEAINLSVGRIFSRLYS